MRYTVQRHPQRRGYTIRDAQPRLQHSEDVEGYGLVHYNPPKQLPPYFGFYKLKRDAESRAADLNKWDEAKVART